MQPIALSIGAAFAALNFDVDLISDLQPTAFKNLFSKEAALTDEEINKHPQIVDIDKMIGTWREKMPKTKKGIAGVENMEKHRDSLKQRLRDGDAELLRELDEKEKIRTDLLAQQAAEKEKEIQATKAALEGKAETAEKAETAKKAETVEKAETAKKAETAEKVETDVKAETDVKTQESDEVKQQSTDANESQDNVEKVTFDTSIFDSTDDYIYEF